MYRSLGAFVLLLIVGLMSFADFQEIIPVDETDAKTETPAPEAKGPSAEELAAAEAERVADAEALRKCAKTYDYSIKKRTLDLRLQQAKLRYDKVVSTTAELFARNPVLGKERRADAQKELDAVNAELKKLENGCTGRSSTDASAPTAPGKDAPKDSAPIKK